MFWKYLILLFFFFKNNFIIYLFIAVFGLHSYSLVVVQGLLAVVASLVAEQGALELMSSVGFVALRHVGS